MADTLRYGLYFVPKRASPLAVFGARVLGRDIETGELVPQARLPSFGAEEMEAITREPRGYGFHATLKPPFRLRDGAVLGTLQSEVQALAARLRAVEVPGFQVAELGGFVALRPGGAESSLAALASECVVALDRFRAALSAAEMTSRRPEQLSPRQRGHLDAWGYPYVHEEFRFHMTLSARLKAERRSVFRQEIEDFGHGILDRATTLEDLTLVRQEWPGGPFVVDRRFPLLA